MIKTIILNHAHKHKLINELGWMQNYNRTNKRRGWLTKITI